MATKAPTTSDTLIEKTGVWRLPQAKAGRVVLPTLRVVAGPNMLRFCSLYPDERVVIGREETCDLFLADGSVSRQHVAVCCDQHNQLTIEDLGSTNGTLLNGEQLARRRPIPLRVGDQITAGGVLIRVDEMGLDELAHLARVVEQLNQASRDPLTGLRTRRYLDEELPRLISRHESSGAPLTCIFFDLDHFKQINDTFGHGVGDDVLRTAARLLAMCTRGSDAAVRYGGEEFVVVLPNCAEAGAWQMAERLRGNLRAHDWSAHGVTGRIVTASMGIATHYRGESPQDWLDRADKALYRAKRGGRDRTVRWSTMSTRL